MIKWAAWNSVIITVAGTPCEAVVIDDGLLVVLEHLKKNVLNETVFSLLSPIISSVFFDSREERHNGCVFWTKALQSHYIHKYQIYFFVPVSFGATTSGPTKYCIIIVNVIVPLLSLSSSSSISVSLCVSWPSYPCAISLSDS